MLERRGEDIMSSKDVSTVVVAMNILYEAEEQLKPLLREYNLSMNEWLVLKIVYLGYVQTPSEVAEYLSTQRASITRYVENLYSKKLLDRVYSPEDRRRVDLIVTTAGKKFAKNVLAKYPNIVNKFPQRLEENDIRHWSAIAKG